MPSISDSSPISCIASMACCMSIGCSPRKLYPWPSPCCGNMLCNFSLSCCTCQLRSMSSMSCSDNCCICERCSGVSEFMSDCIACIRSAICASNSSSVSGFSGKKSPYCSMNCSNCGSSPCSRASIMAFSAAIMSFIRAMSSGDMFCIPSDI